jgi:dephospho-CoA kinase
MKTIGLVGGVASGKSLVAKMLVQLGAGLLDADRAGHDVLAEDADVHLALRERWGEAVFGPDAIVDRGAIARLVFGDDDAAKAEREFLEGLLHPRIGRRLDRLRERHAAEGRPAVVLDAPVLLEAGWGPTCDILLMVDVPRELRLKRALQRGWTEAEFDRREAAQWPMDDKRRSAHVIISNAGTEEELRQEVRKFWNAHIANPKD